MSAVAAIWRIDGRPVGEDIDRMVAALRLYGPDGHGQWNEGGAGIGHCRRLLLPEDRADRQPIEGEGGNLVLAADIRLDNREELADALGLERSRIKGMPDARLLMMVLESWGEEGVSRLVGGFAFVCWDRLNRRLIAARDPLGENSLILHRGSNFLALASMPKGLFALPDVPRRLDEAQIARELLVLPQGAGTLFAEIEQLQPGHLLTANGRTVQRRPYWTPPPPNSLQPIDERAAAEEFDSLLEEAVRCRLRGIGPIGSHLSAGLDSGTVTATAARLLADSGERLTAFTAVPREGYDQLGPAGRPGNEGPGAAALAAMYPNIDHVLVRCEGRTPIDEFDPFISAADQPVFNPSNLLWGNEIARQARSRGIKTMLTGQLGNMTISYHGLDHLSTLLRTGRIVTWLRECRHYSRRPGKRWYAAIGHTVAPLLPRSVWTALERRRGRLWEPLQYSAISADFAREIDIDALAGAIGWDSSYQPRANGHARRVAGLTRRDTAMSYAAQRAAFGLDHRDPTADQRLVSFCLSLPPRYFLQNGIEAYLLKRVMRDRLPGALLVGRQRKGYQSVDWHESLSRSRDAIAEELDRLEASPLAARCLDLPRMRRLLAEWPEDNWHSARVTRSYRLALSRGLSMGRFIRRMEGGNQ